VNILSKKVVTQIQLRFGKRPYDPQKIKELKNEVRKKKIVIGQLKGALNALGKMTKNEAKEKIKKLKKEVEQLNDNIMDVMK
jgi:N-methylhydantoinase A/oxoprolinase/acetone carboxylase beta subunit